MSSSHVYHKTCGELNHSLIQSLSDRFRWFIRKPIAQVLTIQGACSGSYQTLRTEQASTLFQRVVLTLIKHDVIDEQRYQFGI